MPKIPYFFGERLFASKTILNDYLKSLWQDSPLGEPLPPADAMIIRDLLALHPRVDEKVGCGIDYIYVGSSPNGNNRCFYIKRIDGTSTDFGTSKCLHGDRLEALFKSACRVAVEEQIERFRKDFYSSQEGKNLIAAGELIHIDHSSPTFDHLVGRFYESLGIPLQDIKFNGLSSDNESKVTFVDSSISERFAEFHLKNAKLRGVTKRYNLSDNKRGVRKTPVTLDFSVYVKPEEWETLTLTS